MIRKSWRSTVKNCSGQIRQQVTADMVLRAYTVGLFPMASPQDDHQLHWIDPEWRGIIPLETFHISRSLMKVLKRERFEIRYDTAFTAVMRSCAERCSKRAETWINSEIVQLYGELFRQGYAHSVETWREGRLVGGLYGIAIGAVFFGESMFSRESDASKVALCHLVARLRVACYLLLDTQFLTEHLARFGAIAIQRHDYLFRLAEALTHQAIPFCGELPAPVSELLRQARTHTS